MSLAEARDKLKSILTPMQRRALEGLADGQSPDELARQFGLRSRTAIYKRVERARTQLEKHGLALPGRFAPMPLTY